MKRQGRILIVDDKETWRDALSNILQRDGFKTDSAATIDEALNRLKETFYHLAVLDIRMEEGDQTNAEGMHLLTRIDESGLGGAMEVMMLSAYGTREQMREAFAHRKVADFLSKEDFNRADFLNRVREVFATEMGINLDLDIHWQNDSQKESVIRNLKIGETRVKQDASLQARILEELEDLLCRLFHRAKSLLVRPMPLGYSGSAVLWVTPFYEAGAGQPVVVKFGDFRSIDTEYKNFDDYVRNFLIGAHFTSIIDLRRTPYLGGIIYSLLGSASDRVESFANFYSHSDISQIKELLAHLFNVTCGAWYANPGRLELRNLTEEYKKYFLLTTDNLEQVLHDLKSVQGKQKLHFGTLTGERAFTNPIPVAADRQFRMPTYVCITHGDLNENNVLVDESRRAWLIDFARTGPGHILRDVAELDSIVRFQLLMTEDASLDERLAMEDALCNIERFSDVMKLKSVFQTENPALAKAYKTTLHLRSLAYRLVQQNPADDISEYYVALFYYSLNTTRYYQLSSLQRQHALLSASLLADRLGR